MTFFDKMSCRRARVKIKIGMVTFSHPCVYYHLEIDVLLSKYLFKMHEIRFVVYKSRNVARKY